MKVFYIRRIHANRWNNLWLGGGRKQQKILNFNEPGAVHMERNWKHLGKLWQKIMDFGRFLIGGKEIGKNHDTPIRASRKRLQHVIWRNFRQPSTKVGIRSHSITARMQFWCLTCLVDQPPNLHLIRTLRKLAKQDGQPKNFQFHERPREARQEIMVLV